MNTWNTYPTVVGRALPQLLNSLVGKGIIDNNIANAAARYMQNGGVNDFCSKLSQYPDVTEQMLFEQLENYVRALIQGMQEGRVGNSWNNQNAGWGGGNVNQGWNAPQQTWGGNNWGGQQQGWGAQSTNWGNASFGSPGMMRGGNPFNPNQPIQAQPVPQPQQQNNDKPTITPTIARPPRIKYTAPDADAAQSKETRGDDNIVKWATKVYHSTVRDGQAISVVHARTNRIFPSVVELLEFLGVNLNLTTPKYLVQCTYSKPRIEPIAHCILAPVLDQLREGVQGLENHSPKNLIAMVSDILDNQPLKVVNVIKHMIFDRFKEFLDNKFIHTENTLDTRVKIDNNSGVEDLLDFTKHASDPGAMGMFLNVKGYDEVITSVLGQSIATLFNTTMVLSAKDIEDVPKIVDAAGHLSLDGKQTLTDMYLSAEDPLKVSEELMKGYTVIIHSDIVFISNLDAVEDSVFSQTKSTKYMVAGADTCDLDHLVCNEFHYTHPVTLLMTPYRVAPHVFTLGRTVDHKVVVSKV